MALSVVLLPNHHEELDLEWLVSPVAVKASSLDTLVPNNWINQHCVVFWGFFLFVFFFVFIVSNWSSLGEGLDTFYDVHRAPFVTNGETNLCASIGHVQLEYLFIFVTLFLSFSFCFVLLVMWMHRTVRRYDIQEHKLHKKKKDDHVA